MFVALALIFQTSAFAVSLVKYKQNVSDAGVLLDSLQPSDEFATQRERTENEVAALQNVRRMLPPKQQIEFDGAGSVEVDNAWLETSLKEFEKTSSGSKERQEILRQMTERLGAIEERLTELEKAQASGKSKNDNKQKLDEILRRPEFQKPDDKNKTYAQRLYDDFVKWWRDFWRGTEPDIAEEIVNSPDTVSSLSQILQIVVIALALGIIGFIIWRFVLPFVQSNRKIAKSKKNEPRIVLGEQLLPNETADDLFTQADKLAQNGEVRAAIRKGYIALLCELNDRKVLGLAKHKTNRDYLRDVQKDFNLHSSMKGMTSSYENHWYGFVPANEEDWQEFRSEYRKSLGR